MPPCLWACKVENLPPRGVFFSFRFCFLSFFLFHSSSFFIVMYHCLGLQSYHELWRACEATE